MWPNPPDRGVTYGTALFSVRRYLSPIVAKVVTVGNVTGRWQPRARRPGPESGGQMQEVAAVPRAGDASAVRTIELSIRGMTCAACAARVESKLTAAGGEVAASVNFATERATIAAPQAVSARTLVAAVEAAGYTAQVVIPAGAPGAGAGAGDTDDGQTARYLRRRLLLALIF